MPNLFDNHKLNHNNLAQNITLPLARNSSAPEINPISQNVHENTKVTASDDVQIGGFSNPILISDQEYIPIHFNHKTFNQYSSAPTSPSTTLRERLANRGVTNFDRFTTMEPKVDYSQSKHVQQAGKRERTLSIEIDCEEDDGEVVKIPTFGEIKDEIDHCSSAVLSRKHLYEVVGQVENDVQDEERPRENYKELTNYQYDSGKRENTEMEAEHELERKTWEYTHKLYTRLLEREDENWGNESRCFQHNQTALKVYDSNSQGLKQDFQQQVSMGTIPEIKLCRRQVHSYQDISRPDEPIEVKKLMKEMQQNNQNTRGYLIRKASCPEENERKFEANSTKNVSSQKPPQPKQVKSRVSHMRHCSDGQKSFDTRDNNDALEKATAHYLNKIMNQSFNNTSYINRVEKKSLTQVTVPQRNTKTVQDINRIHNQARRESIAVEDNTGEKINSTSKILEPKRVSLSIEKTSGIIKDRSIEIQSTRNSKGIFETSVPVSNKSYTSKKFNYNEDVSTKLTELQKELAHAKITLAKRKAQEETKQSQSVLSQKIAKPTQKKEELKEFIRSPKADLSKVFRSQK